MDCLGTTAEKQDTCKQKRSILNTVGFSPFNPVQPSCMCALLCGFDSVQIESGPVVYLSFSQTFLVISCFHELIYINFPDSAL